MPALGTNHYFGGKDVRSGLQRIFSNREPAESVSSLIWLNIQRTGIMGKILVSIPGGRDERRVQQF